MKTLCTTSFSILFASKSLFAADVNVNADESSSGFNTEIISQLILEVTDADKNTFIDTQNAPATTDSLASSALLQSITLDSGVALVSFDPLTPAISSFTTSGSVTVNIFTPTTTIPEGDTGFSDALADTHSNADIMNYISVDGSSGLASWDLLYDSQVGLGSSDYLIVEERDGNTSFNVTPLDLNGTPIAGSNTLFFDDFSAGSSYQWDTGLQNVLDSASDNQTQQMTVLSLDLFNTGSTPIGGFAIENTGRADIKFFIGSIPEPSTALLSALALPSLLIRRRFQK